MKGNFKVKKSKFPFLGIDDEHTINSRKIFLLKAYSGGVGKQ